MSAPSSITSFRGKVDLARVRDLVFKNIDDTQILANAVACIELWQTRGKLPHAIDATTWIISARIDDPMFQTNIESRKHEDIYRDEELPNSTQLLLRHAYSSALVRFVNGILDPYQSGHFATALSTLATDIGLPYLFVEIRHWATHEQLPSLALLRETSRRALIWIYDNYWDKLENRYFNGENQIENYSHSEKFKEKIASFLIAYEMQFRKNRPDYVSNAARMSSETGPIDYLSKISADSHRNFYLARLLAVRIVLLQEKDPFATQASLGPLVASLHSGLHLKLIHQLIYQSLSRRFSNRHRKLVGSCLPNWLEFLISRLLHGSFPVLFDRHLYYTEKQVTIVLENYSWLFKCIGLVKETLRKARNGKASTKTFKLAPLLDDILSEAETTSTSNTVTKVKRKDFFEMNTGKRQKKHQLFRNIVMWKSRPFGVKQGLIDQPL